MTNFKFVLQGDDNELNKDKELRNAEARAHAARAAHQSRKLGKKCASPQPNINHTGQIGKFALPTYRRYCRKLAAQEKVAQRQTNPITLHGQSKIDPFSSTPSAQVPAYLLEALDFAWTSVWANLRPPVQIGHIHSDTVTWRHASTNHPALYHAGLSAAANLVMANLSNHPKLSQLKNAQIYHNIAAIRFIRDELARAKIPSEELLLAVFCLATHSVIREGATRRSREPNIPSPISGSSKFRSVVNLKGTPEHEKALWILVKQKGGLDKIKLPGLREVLSVYSILHATRYGSVPELPQLENEETSSRYAENLASHSQRLGAAFGDSQLLEVGTELIAILQSCSQITAALEEFQRERDLTDLDPWYMIDARHVLHYQLLSLKARHPDHNSSTIDVVYETCRLGALIYVDLNIWPTHIVSGVRTRMARKLGRVLQCPSSQLAWDDYNALLTWGCCIGAIAASGAVPDPEVADKMGEYRKLFVSYLANRSYHLESWTSFHGTVSRYLWWDYTMQREAEQLWDEIRLEKLLRNVPSVD